MQDIAAHLGISRVAVSKALNNRPGVSEQTRQRVRDVAREFGYERYSGRRSGRRAAGVVGLLASSDVVRPGTVPVASSLAYYASLIWEIERAASERGLHLLLRSFEVGSPEVGVEAGAVGERETNGRVREAPGGRVAGVRGGPPPRIPLDHLDGVLVVGPCPTQLLAHVAAKIPAVTVNHIDGAVPVSSVMAAEMLASAQVTSRLIARGHRCIGFLGSSGPAPSYAYRWFGFCDALRQAGLEPDPARCLHGAAWHHPGQNSEWLQQQFAASEWRSTTAYVLADARLAFVLRDLLQELEPSRLAQIDLAGFLHAPLADARLPRITLARIRLDAMAEEAISLLVEQMEHPVQRQHPRPPRHVLIPPEIVEE